MTGEPFSGPFVPEQDPSRTIISMKRSAPFSPQQRHQTPWSHRMPYQQKMAASSPGLMQQFLSPPSSVWGSVPSGSGGSLYSHVPMGNLGPSPNIHFGSPYSNHPQQAPTQSNSSQEKHGIPIINRVRQYHKYPSQPFPGSYGGMSPMYASPLNVPSSSNNNTPNMGSYNNAGMPMLYGTPSTSNSNGGGGSWNSNVNHIGLSPQQGRWAQRRGSDHSQLLEQFSSAVQVSDNANRNSAQSNTAPCQLETKGRHKSTGSNQRGKPPLFFRTKPPIHAESAASSSPNNESDTPRPPIDTTPPLIESDTADNWNPFFQDEDLVADNGEPGTNSNASIPRHYHQSQHHSRGTRSRSNSFKKNSSSGGNRNNKSRSFKGTGSFVSSSSYDVSSYDPMYGMNAFSPATSSFGLGLSPSSLSSEGFMQQQQHQMQTGGSWRSHNNSMAQQHTGGQQSNKRQQKR